MELEEVKQELELAGLDNEKIRKIMMAIQRTGFDPKDVDKKLKTMGIDPIFEHEYED